MPFQPRCWSSGLDLSCAKGRRNSLTGPDRLFGFGQISWTCAQPKDKEGTRDVAIIVELCSSAKQWKNAQLFAVDDKYLLRNEENENHQHHRYVPRTHLEAMEKNLSQRSVAWSRATRIICSISTQRRVASDWCSLIDRYDRNNVFHSRQWGSGNSWVKQRQEEDKQSHEKRTCYGRRRRREKSMLNIVCWEQFYFLLDYINQRARSNEEWWEIQMTMERNEK